MKNFSFEKQSCFFVWFSKRRHRYANEWYFDIDWYEICKCKKQNDYWCQYHDEISKRAQFECLT
jgi:hypothetical protein